MASTEAPQVGESVAAAQHQHQRGGSSIDQIRHHRLYGWASTLDLDQFDGPRTSLRLAESLRNYLKHRAQGTKDDELDDAVCNLIGMHDAWKVFDRVCRELQATASTDRFPLGDVPEPVFVSILSGNETEYLADCGVASNLQHLLADFFRAHWQPVTHQDDEKSPQNNATDSGDSQVDGGDVVAPIDAGQGGEPEGRQASAASDEGSSDVAAEPERSGVGEATE